MQLSKLLPKIDEAHCECMNSNHIYAKDNREKREMTFSWLEKKTKQRNNSLKLIFTVDFVNSNLKLSTTHLILRCFWFSIFFPIRVKTAVAITSIKKKRHSFFLSIYLTPLFSFYLSVSLSLILCGLLICLHIFFNCLTMFVYFSLARFISFYVYGSLLIFGQNQATMASIGVNDINDFWLHVVHDDLKYMIAGYSHKWHTWNCLFLSFLFFFCFSYDERQHITLSH